jgi:hypothetical protein
MRSVMKNRIVAALTPRTFIVPVIATIAVAGLFTTSCDVHGISDPGTLSSMTVAPNPAVMAVGTTQQFAAHGADYSGASAPVSPTWTVVGGGGTITGAGLFTAGGTLGTFTGTVKATNGSIIGAATVVVVAGPLATITLAPSPASVAVGAAQQFTAVGRDAAGNVLTMTPTWTVEAGGGTIGAGTGLFTAGSTPGSFPNTVKATSGGIFATATVTVTSGVLATIAVAPNPTSIGTGAQRQFTAIGRDAGGNVVAITPSWSVVAGGGTINLATGLFTAGNSVATFANTIRANVGGISGFATVTVTGGTLASITVTPNPVSMQISTSQPFTAVGRDASGNVVAFTPVWTVINGGGSINAGTGVFLAGATVGTFSNTVQATNTSGTLFGTATVTTTLTAPVLASILVTPNPASVLTFGTQPFIAEGKDASGNDIAITPVWSVVNGGGSINAGTGLFTAGSATGTFVNTVKATSGSISGTATVLVVSSVPSPLVDLGTAAANGIMAGTAVTCITGGVINANVSISPGSTVTGFGPCVITGVQHLNDAVAIQGQVDLTTAYNTLAGLPCPPANAIVANLGGTTKPAGVYCTATGIGVTGTLTLDGGGDPNATFVFQAGSSLTTAGSIVLINSAQAKNVYWQVGSSATIGTASAWQGNILALTSITLVDTATLLGRALARNGAVTLGTNNIIILP